MQKKTVPVCIADAFAHYLMNSEQITQMSSESEWLAVTASGRMEKIGHVVDPRDLFVEPKVVDLAKSGSVLLVQRNKIRSIIHGPDAENAGMIKKELWRSVLYTEKGLTNLAGIDSGCTSTAFFNHRLAGKSQGVYVLSTTNVVGKSNVPVLLTEVSVVLGGLPWAKCYGSLIFDQELLRQLLVSNLWPSIDILTAAAKHFHINITAAASQNDVIEWVQGKCPVPNEFSDSLSQVGIEANNSIGLDCLVGLDLLNALGWHKDEGGGPLVFSKDGHQCVCFTQPPVNTSVIF
jgi:hypothetical protein